MKYLIKRVLFIYLLIGVGVASAEKHVPELEELLAVKAIGSVQISPDGQHVLYTVSENEFENDVRLAQLWLYNRAEGSHIQLTHGEKSVGSISWTPDSNHIIFMRDGKVMVMNRRGGEARALDIKQKNIGGLKLSDDASILSFVGSPEEQKEKDRREDHMGDFEVIKADGGHRHIYRLELTKDLKIDGDATAVTSGSDFSVTDYDMSSDGSNYAFTSWDRPDLASMESAKLQIVDADGENLRILDENQSLKGVPVFSPDDSEIAYSVSAGFAYNNVIHVISPEGGVSRAVSADFDESIWPAAWTDQGIHFVSSQKTNRHFYLLDPTSSVVSRADTPLNHIVGGFSVSNSGGDVAYTAAVGNDLYELFIYSGGNSQKVTNKTAQMEEFILANREIINWQADDGATIEGVLTTPVDFDPSKKYPLFVITHGGPTGTDRPTVSVSGLYPIDNWVGNGAVVLRTNYRGSAGYGEEFRRLNWRNLGMGPATDIIAGINHLVAQGFVDESKIGCLGWSQGGHISAMLATYSDRCTVAHMGAGISNWETYYYNTDITLFTVQYFGKTPVDDPEVYDYTSPMTYIKNAKTPVLIQHGENDNRVPIANAYELRQALNDVGVDNHMIVYKGMPHGPRTPKTLRAVQSHLDAWFGHYLFDRPAPDFATYGIPEEEDSDEEEEEIEE